MSAGLILFVGVCLFGVCLFGVCLFGVCLLVFFVDANRTRPYALRSLQKNGISDWEVDMQIL